MKLDVKSLSLPGVKLVRSMRSADWRRFFAETFVHRDFAAAGIDNQLSRTINHVRPQREPYEAYISKLDPLHRRS